MVDNLSPKLSYEKTNLNEELYDNGLEVPAESGPRADCDSGPRLPLDQADHLESEALLAPSPVIYPPSSRYYHGAQHQVSRIYPDIAPGY